MFQRAVLALLLLLSACDRAHDDPAHSPGAASARDRAIAWLKTATFEQADRTIECQPDCRAQERGFAYAREHQVEQPGDCDLTRGRPNADDDFIEGCRAYGQYLEAAERGS